MAIDQLTIGRFSQITHLTQKALRLYDEKGILRPTIKDEQTGYRYYGLRQIEKGLKIKYLVWIGFSLSEIEEILQCSEKNDNEKVQALFTKKLKDIHQEMDRLKKIENLLTGSKTVKEIFQSCTPPIMKDVPKTRVVSKREIGSYGKTIGKLIGEILQQIFTPENRKAFVNMVGPPITIYHDADYKENDADIEVAVPINGRIVVDDQFEVKNLPEMRVISTLYSGPYEGIHEGYATLYDFAAQENLIIDGNPRDLYIVSPPKPPDELITEIQIPIKNESNEKV